MDRCALKGYARHQSGDADEYGSSSDSGGDYLAPDKLPPSFDIGNDDAANEVVNAGDPSAAPAHVHVHGDAGEVEAWSPTSMRAMLWRVISARRSNHPNLPQDTKVFHPTPPSYFGD